MARPKRSAHPAIDVRAHLLAHARERSDRCGSSSPMHDFYTARIRRLIAHELVQVSRWQLPREVRDGLRAAHPGDDRDRFEVDGAGDVRPLSRVLDGAGVVRYVSQEIADAHPPREADDG